VLLVRSPHAQAISFGADTAADFKSAEELLKEASYQVVVIPCEPQMTDEALQFLDSVNSVSPLTQRIIIQNGASPDLLRQMINKGNVFKILARFDDTHFERTILEALEEYSLVRQNTKLLALVNEQNESLKKLTSELEDRIEKRQSFLEESRQRLLSTNERVEALHRALVAVHRAGSISEMERLITEALQAAMGLAWTRIAFSSQASVDKEPIGRQGNVYVTTLQGQGKDEIGKILFARESGSSFSRDEMSFLAQIAEAVSLAVMRLTTLQESETLKHQWEATFDAILDPVCLIDENFVVQRSNRAFAKRSNTDIEKTIGLHCYKILFGRETPCEGCTRGSGFRLKPARTADGSQPVYDVFSQSIQANPRQSLLFVNMYHDISDQLRLERQILESAKMAELGVIGSSIAHELNNPLGGMLSFLQLIRMDLKGDEPYYSDIIEMEKGAIRCGEIVKNLLGFTRKSSHESTRETDLRDVVRQAVKITELQTRSMGIQIDVEVPENPVIVAGQFNVLAQAVRNCLQNAQEAISESRRIGQQRPGQISVAVTETERDCIVEIGDNGVGIPVERLTLIFDALYTTKDPDRNPGLGLTVARQIIHEHGGQLEISSRQDVVNKPITTAKIRLPRVKSSASSSERHV